MDEGQPDVDLQSLRELESELSLDDLFETLADDYARYALYWLSEHPHATLERLADVVVGIEAAVTDTVAAPSDHERARIRLYHSVLPRLDALGYVEFDTDDRTVTRATVPPELWSLLDLDD